MCTGAGQGCHRGDAGGTRAALTSAVLVAEVGEAPDVSQADDLPSHRQDVLQLVVPLPSLQGLVLLLFLLLFHTRPRGHRFAIANGARDSVIHPTFRRSFLCYAHNKPCNEAKTRAMEGQRGERTRAGTHVPNPYSAVCNDSCWKEGTKATCELWLCQSLKSHSQLHYF